MANGLVITVNGKPHRVEAAPDTPLLYVLRNELGLNGPQFGCGSEKCGACMILLGAKAQQSCKMPVSDAAGGAITTLEGLSRRRGITSGAARLYRGASRTVWLLQQRHDHGSRRAAVEESASDR